MRTEDIQNFWRRFADAFAHPLTAHGALSGFIKNAAVTGAYSEIWVRQLAHKMLPGLRVSTGAIITTADASPDSDLRKVPQIDVLIWDPTVLPALYEDGDFAIVHTISARAVIEVKHTASLSQKLRLQLGDQRQRLLSECQAAALCVLVSHKTPPEHFHVRTDWPASRNSGAPTPVIRLIDGKSGRPDVDGIFSLVYFLDYVSRLPRPRTT